MIGKLAAFTASALTAIMFYTATFGDPSPNVYEPIENYKVQRFTDDNGRDTIKFWAVVKKNFSCDVERGSGPIWVDLLFKDNYRAASALYNSRSQFVSTTVGRAGDSINVDGYFFIGKDHFVDGVDIPLTSAVINVPCEMDQSTGYRKVIARLSPILVPAKGETLIVGDGYDPSSATVE